MPNPSPQPRHDGWIIGSLKLIAAFILLNLLFHDCAMKGVNSVGNKLIEWNSK
jgi:hypothetical protein